MSDRCLFGQIERFNMTFPHSKIFLILFLFSFFIPINSKAEILHLELGAANHWGNRPDRFLMLDAVLNDLVERHGTTGIIYLNDLEERKSDLNQAARYVSKWLRERNIRDVKVVKIPRDIRFLEIPSELNSASLNNPTPEMLANPELKEVFERIAYISKSGLRISSAYFEPMRSFGSTLSFSRLIETGQRGYRYYWPYESEGSGKLPQVTMTNLYFLRSISKPKKCASRLR